MNLSSLKPAKGSIRNTKRIGRGNATGQGRTAGKGHKGYQSRSGTKNRFHFEGGQTPLMRRLPKRGFSNYGFRKDVQIVNLDKISDLGLEKINPEILVEKGVLKLSGFESDSAYEFCFFGSRTASDNRETLYTVIGQNSDSATLNAASNTDEIACVQGIQADENGEIFIEVTSGSNNDNANGFFYINAMRIAPEE